MQTTTKRVHLSWEECLDRYPLICRAIAHILIGSRSEAACCLRDYRDGHRYGSEAVSHSGLSPADRLRAACSSDWRKAVRYWSPATRAS